MLDANAIPLPAGKLWFSTEIFPYLDLIQSLGTFCEGIHFWNDSELACLPQLDVLTRNL